MNKAYFFVALLLIGGFTGCVDEVKNDELIDVSVSEAMYVIASKVFVDSFNDALYGAICDKLMYEDGTFYDSGDSSECLRDADDQYSREGKDAMFAPDWEYVMFENTDKQASSTGDIYRVSGVGLWCDRGADSCHGERFTELYMAKNTDSGDWGYAAEGFRTTDGGYLEVVWTNP